MTKNLFIFFFSISFILPIWGQNIYSKNYTVNDGLPSSEVYHSIQDKNGDIWFATDRGICRYDGYEFKAFGIKDGLTDNTVFQFYPQKDGTIWCTTFNRKLFYFNLDCEFTEYEFNSAIKTNAVIKDICFFKENLYISFLNKTGYLEIDSTGLVITQASNIKPSYLIVSEQIGEVFFTYSLGMEDNIDLISDGNYIDFTSQEGDSFRSAKCKNNSAFFSGDKVFMYTDSLVLIEDSCLPVGIGKFDETHFWVGYRYGGIKVYNEQGKQIYWWLTNQSVTNVMTDHEGGVWFTTLANGVFYIKNLSFLSHLEKNSTDNHVNSLATDNSGNIFIGYYNGDVLKKNKDTSLIYYQSSKKRPANIQYYKSEDKLIIASDNSVFYLENSEKKLLYDGYSLSFSDDSENEISFGVYSGLVIVKNTAKRKVVNARVEDVCIAPSGYLLATVEGIRWFDGSTLKTIGEHPLLEYRVSDIDNFKTNYYAASLGAGLIVFNKDEIYNIGEKDGLYSNITTEIFVENDSTIWVCTNKGLNKVILSKNGKPSIYGLSHADGLISNEITDVEVVNDRVWVGTRKGLCSFEKHIIDEINTAKQTYFLNLDEVLINDNKASIKELNELSYKQNKLEFKYRAKSFRYNNDLLYRYKLENLDNNWTFTKALHINYPSIPPGSYIFKLQVKSHHGNWVQNEITFPITIYPPFYNTWWFYLLVFIALATLVYLFFKVKILSYNKDITRELLRHILKRLKRNSSYVVFKEKGKDIRIDTIEILYIKAAGNYLEIYTTSENYLIRCKIGEFLEKVPDPIEFLRIHRSYIVRLDKITQKNNKMVIINQTELPLGETYRDSLKKIHF